MIKSKKNYVVDMLTWRSGGCVDFGEYLVGKGETTLLNPEGYSCCLGQCALQDGIPDNQLLLRGSPLDVQGEELWENFTQGAPWIDNRKALEHTSFSETAMRYNDSTNTTVKDRMSSLRRLFKSYNMTLKFKNVKKFFTQNPHLA